METSLVVAGSDATADGGAAVKADKFAGTAQQKPEQIGKIGGDVFVDLSPGDKCLGCGGSDVKAGEMQATLFRTLRSSRDLARPFHLVLRCEPAFQPMRVRSF